MIDFNKWLAAYAAQKSWKLITDTSYGLNVDSDAQITDAEDPDSQDEVFYNVIESGSFDNTSDIALTVTRNFEVGLFRRCIKETSGPTGDFVSSSIDPDESFFCLSFEVVVS